MNSVQSPAESAFEPILWILTHCGTNGYRSTWGAILAGCPPQHG
ncbi:hypothetical protein [Rhodococcoides kyotonense]|nr:hypothetical protein [Rhodococcus kyotonensis]